MKQLQFAVGLLATVASCSLYAQTMNARANIPFEFRVGEKLMPAGDYSIHHTGSLVFLQESNGHASAAFLTQATELKSEKPVLEFNQYGDAYFLAKLSIPGSDIGRAVMKTPREKELARRINRPGQTTVAFERK